MKESTISSIKPIHLTRAIHRWLQRHQDVSEQWIVSVVTWTEHPSESEDYQLEKLTAVKGKVKKITLWIQNYSWRYFV